MKLLTTLAVLLFSFSTSAQEEFSTLLRQFEGIGQSEQVECRPPLLKEELDAESKKLAEKKWFSGAPDCSKPDALTPPYEVVQVNDSYYVMRQNKCINFEAPFLYLYIGKEKALLIDTGATEDPASMPLRAWVDEVLKKQPNGDKLKLIVAHSHSHGDHVAGDEQFRDRPNTTVVGYSPSEVAKAFNIKNWPNGEGEIDLGGRKLSILPIPGHESSSIAVYDHQTKDLVSGDTLYPGNIFLSEDNYGEFRSSVKRLYNFSKTHKVRNILGAHVEMSDTPGKDFPYGSTYQPDEHKLPLRQEHLDELHDYLEQNDKPVYKKFADFIINV